MVRPVHTMEPQEDPFDSVHAEVRSRWREIEADYALWSETLSARNLVALEAKTAAISSALRNIDWDLQDLDEAVQVAHSNPNNFSLSAADVAARKQAVSSLHADVARVRAAVEDEQVSRMLVAAKRDTLLNYGGHDRSRASAGKSQSPETGHLGGAAQGRDGWNDQVEQQELLMQQQDEGLEDLAQAVQRIGVMGREMHTELQEHGVMLEDLEAGLDSSSSRMQRIQRRLDEFVAETSRGQLCTIVFLFFFFILLTFLVFAT